MGALVKPRWIVGHLLAITAIVGFVRLGAWQLDRHGEKIELREAVEHGQMLPVVPLDSAEDGSYRRVTASGSYDSELQALVLRSHDGRSGYHVLTPLRGAGGGVVVDRGWISLDDPVPDPPPGPVTVEGALWPAEEGSSIPDDWPPVVRRIDPEIQAAFAPYEVRSDYLVLETGDGLLPVPADAPEIALGPHLGYAGQWFLFGVIVLVGYPLLLRRASRGADDD